MSQHNQTNEATAVSCQSISKPRVYLAAIPQDGPDYPARMYQDDSGKWVREVRNFFSGEYIRCGAYLSSERAQLGGLDGRVSS